MTRNSLSATVALALLALACHVSHAAADPARASEEFRQALLHLAQSGHLGDGTGVIERPAERVANMGLLLDRDSADGLRVLGTLPGGSAERMGLRAGDRLLAANGIDLTGPGGTGRMRAIMDGPEAQSLSLTLVRDGREQALSGAVETFDLPAMRVELTPGTGSAAPVAMSSQADPDSTCGRISVFENAPRSQNLFAARLIQVDGDLPGPSSQETFRVSPGRHTLTVAEAIDPDYLSGVANRQRARNSGDNRKTLEVTIEPGMTYYLAAKLHGEPGARAGDGAYWEPVVWKQAGERCR